MDARQQRDLLIPIVASMIILGLFEVLIRGLGYHASYGEKNGSPYYFSIFQANNLNSWYFVHEPDQYVRYEKAEFIFERSINSLGLSEQEIPFEKDTNEFRILGLGDSFTEGDGTAYDSTWLKVLERGLQRENPEIRIQTVNAGIGGSDPVFACKLFEDKLGVYQPDLVLLSINPSDIEDLTIRGGFDRFRSDGTVQVTEPYKWEWLYGISYTFRLIIHHGLGYSDHLNLDKLHPKTETPAMIMQAVNRLKQLCEERDAAFMVIVHPLRNDFEGEEYDWEEMNVLIDSLSANGVSYLDLKPWFMNAGYTNLEEAKEIYWEKNGHFNPIGYRIYGEGVKEALSLEENRLDPAERLLDFEKEERVSPK